MSLADLQIKTKYSKTQCNILEDFYIPCMRESVKYDRLSGYFSSGIYLLIWDALQEFIDNSGKIRLVCSPNLSNEDKLALKEGVKSKSDDILSKSLLDDYNMMLNLEAPIPSKLLACLVSQGILDIKLAVLPTDSLYHDKVGTFTDAEGNVVGFRGAMNETYKGLSPDGNIESVETCSTCEGERDAERAREAQESFDEIWYGRVDDILIYDLPSSVRYQFLEVSKNENISELIYNLKKSKKTGAKTRTDTREPRPHQKAALKDWEIKGRRGLLEHATGSGKTFTAICAIREALTQGETPLILVPSRDLMVQWKKELSSSLHDLSPIILECDGANPRWKLYIANFSKPSDGKHIIVATIQTASTSQFINNISDSEHIFLVADEVHRYGSTTYRNVFSINSGPRLGLSATPKRYNDAEGTSAIYQYFVNELQPVYTLDDAIRDKVLTEYEYHPHLVTLTDEEEDEWRDISAEIRKIYARLKNKNKDNPNAKIETPALKKLYIRRSRILKSAKNKIALACEILKEYRYGERWIVYCDTLKQLDELYTALKKEPKLKSETILRYHSELSEDDRNANLNFIEKNSAIMLSVKCLDEGVDIPAVSHALIIASSKNPREFIQRRGRILRKYAGKSCSYLHDILVAPSETSRDDLGHSILNAEIARAIQFGAGAKNPNCIARLKDIAVEYDIKPDIGSEGYD